MDANHIISNIKDKVYRLFKVNLLTIKNLKEFSFIAKDFVNHTSYGCGGIIRDYDGNFIIAYGVPLPKCTVIFAELSALFYGLNLCVSLGIDNIWIEVDALYMLNYFTDNKDRVNIKQLLRSLNVKISHIHREGNACADWFANVGSKLQRLMDFSYSELSNIIKGLIRLDKGGLPYIKGILAVALYGYSLPHFEGSDAMLGIPEFWWNEVFDTQDYLALQG
ncbi:hypothetical protein M5K25_007196 [Dendrobium thyrsiflorum]|uniref:RNase H type-1 domain-containing protein n=1 Tax=Dendrobium thyrsiflorum TaxID=117978 RepID=A0ABD0VDM8_DENTH